MMNQFITRLLESGRGVSLHLFVLIAFLGSGGVLAQSIVETAYEPGEVIVQLVPSVDAEGLRTDLTAYGLQPKKLLSARLNIWLMGYAHAGFRSIEHEQVLSDVRNHADVTVAQFNHFVELRGTTPNDPSFSLQWDKHNTGQSGGTVDADIDAPEAWDLGTSGTTADGDQIVIAIVDGGCDLGHIDIDFWKNSGETPGNGIDDDGNGYIDDYDGWNAYSSNGSIPSNSHGTHVAGIAAAKGNNGTGISGVNWGAKVLPVAGSSGTESTVVEAYGYIIELRATYNETNGASGAFIVSTNSSFGVNQGNPANYPIWCEMYNSMGELGILSAAATANANWNIDVVGDVPTACASNYLVSVTNTTNTDQRNPNAGYGATTIDLGAPGTSIYSTLPGNSYGYNSGTSMATPQVAGAIALMYSAAGSDFISAYKTDPGGMALQVKQWLLDGTDPIAALNGITVSGGRLNANNANNSISEFVLPPIADFSGSPTTGSAPLLVNFTDLSTGSITSWDWNFGDLGTSTLQNPSHTYNNAGTYTVSLLVTGPGGSDPELKAGYITVSAGSGGTVIWVEHTFGDDITGNGSKTSPYQTIGQAISLGQDNDTVMVGPGLYTENIDFGGKKLTVHGLYGPEVTTLKPAIPNQYTITMTSGEPAGTEFSGFTVTDGGDNYTVYISGDAQPLIQGNIFYYNIKNVPGNNKSVIRTGYNGSDNSHPTVRDNLFYDNGGISCVAIYYGDGSILNNTFDNNNRGFLTISSKGTAKNNIVTNSLEYGVYGFWTTFTDNNVWQNSPDYQGGNADPLLNISADPLYMDAASGVYFIEHNSPSVGTGEGGVDMGPFQVEYVGLGNHTTIQAAIDASGIGDYVLVYPGSYNEFLFHQNKGVKVISIGGPDVTDLSPPDAAGTPIWIEAAGYEYSQFSGFSFHDNPLDDDRTVCWILTDAIALLTDNKFSDCLQTDTDRNRAVVSVDGSNVYITRNVFKGNKGLATIAAGGDGFAHVINNTFYSEATAIRGVGTINGVVRNNIIYMPTDDFVTGTWEDIDYNVMWNNATAYGSNDILADPMVDPVTLALQAGSPCIDAGHPDEFYQDADGTVNDIGALLFTAPPAVVNVPGDYSTIQAGIDAVAANGEVFVAAGTFTENIDFSGKTCRVVGIGNTGGDTTFLEPAIPDNPTVTISADEGVGTELTGFTIRNGGNSVTIWIGNNASPRIGENIFYDNILPSSTNKCVIQCMAPSGTPLIERNLFYNNYGISCVGIWSNAYAEIINNTMDNNARGFLTISSSGGIAKNNIVTNSTAYGVYGSTWTELSYNDFYNNSPNYNNATPGIGSITADPLYKSSATGNYNINSFSPCVDAGDPDPSYNDPDGSRNDMGAFVSVGLPIPMALKSGDGLPEQFALHHSYPNPFNPETTISYDLPEASNVSLVIYNIVGQQVITLVNRHQAAGRYDVVWNSTDSQQRKVASGVYLYRLITDQFVDAKKMILLK